MLLTGDSSVVEFAASLLKLGNGAMASANQDGTISMNNIGKTDATLQQLQGAVFPNVAHTVTSMTTSGYAKEPSWH